MTWCAPLSDVEQPASTQLLPLRACCPIQNLFIQLSHIAKKCGPWWRKAGCANYQREESSIQLTLFTGIVWNHWENWAGGCLYNERAGGPGREHRIFTMGERVVIPNIWGFILSGYHEEMKRVRCIRIAVWFNTFSYKPNHIANNLGSQDSSLDLPDTRKYAFDGWVTYI